MYSLGAYLGFVTEGCIVVSDRMLISILSISAEALDGKCPSQVGNVYNRLVSFQLGQFACRTYREVVNWYLTKTGREVLPDKTVTV